MTTSRKERYYRELVKVYKTYEEQSKSLDKHDGGSATSEAALKDMKKLINELSGNREVWYSALWYDYNSFQDKLYIGIEGYEEWGVRVFDDTFQGEKMNFKEGRRVLRNTYVLIRFVSNKPKRVVDLVVTKIDLSENNL